VSDAARLKIERRRSELSESGMIRGKTPIVNVQDDPEIVELHDGNASAVAWLLHAEAQNIPPVLGTFMKAFDKVILLRNRMHSNGEIWHPYVPPEVKCADRLQRVCDAEQEGREVRKAITLEGEAVYFDNEEFFAGEDAADTLGAMAREYTRRSHSGV
jgi:hypothetical protein